MEFIQEALIGIMSGTISAEIAEQLVLSQYARFEEGRWNEEAHHAEKELRDALQKVMISRDASDHQGRSSH